MCSTHLPNQQLALNLAGIYRLITDDEVGMCGSTYNDADVNVLTHSVVLNLYFRTMYPTELGLVLEEQNQAQSLWTD